MAAALLLAAAGCDAGDGLRTIPPAPAGAPMLCTPARALAFALRIDLAASDPVWGVWPNGERFAIYWPASFQLVRGAEPAVVDDVGRIVGRDGQVIADAMGSVGGGSMSICGLGDRVYDLDE